MNKRSEFTVVPHTSEVALELIGGDWPAFLDAALRGLLHLYGGPEALGEETREVELSAEGPEELLVAWLNELVYLIATKRWVPRRVEAAADGRELKAKLFGGPLQGRLKLEIKAATFGGLKVESKDGELRATVILDV